MATAESTPVGGRAGRRLDTETVVEVAGVLVDRIGPDRLSLSVIARELGVTQPAVYRHIDGLAGLWRALGLSTRALLADELAEAAVGLSGDEAVKAVASAWRRFAHAHPGRYRSADRYAVAGDGSLERAAHRTIAVLEQLLQGYDLPDGERRYAADTLRSALHGFAAYELGDGHPDPDSLDASFDRMVAHLCLAFSS